MQKGKELYFDCIYCQGRVTFSLFEASEPFPCPHCGKRYAFNDDTLLRQLQLFEGLCKQIHASEEILSQTQVGIDVEGHQVRIPFKLLLTRLNPTLDLMIGNRAVQITFRMEPITEMATLSGKKRNEKST